MCNLLSDIILSPTLRYEAHRLIYTPANDEPLILPGFLSAALLAAWLVDTPDGDARGIAIDTSDQRYAFFARYEREVLHDDWGYLSAEVNQLHDAYIELAASGVQLSDICPNIRLLDLAMQMTVHYMRHLVFETYQKHIWEHLPWQAPFAAWLIDAARIETRRQRYMHTDWTDPVQVTSLAELPDEPEQPTLVFEGEAATDIMQRYLDWLLKEYTAQLNEIPGAKPKAAKYSSFLLKQETDSGFLLDEVQTLTDAQRQLWDVWMGQWILFVTHRIKPEKPLLFWTDDLDEKRQAQLTQFIRMQEKEWDYYKRIAAAVYALRQLGYVRRGCAVGDIIRWLSLQLVNDYTEKNRRDQFIRAWKELGRYHEDVVYFVEQLESYGVRKFIHPMPESPSLS